MRAVAIEAHPIDPATGSRVTLRFCDADDDRLTAWNGETFWPGIFRNLALNREAWNGDWTTPISLPQAAFDVTMLALRLADPASPVYRWAGAPLTIYFGERGSTLTVLFEGRVLSHTIEGEMLKLTAQVDSEPFEGDVLTLAYDGSGIFGGGDPDLREFPKPACFGFCRNVEPLRINNVDNVFQVHGYGSIEGFDGLYERARAYSAPLADYPTYEALVAATVPEGSWATCLALGMFRMGAPPYGTITVDVRGDNVGGFHQTTAAIVLRLCEIAGVDLARVDTDSLDALAAAVPYPVNLYVTQREILIDLIQRFVQPCNAQAAFSWAGQLQVTRFGTIPAPTLTLDAQGRSKPAVLAAEELPMLVPWWRLEMTGERNWRPMSKDEIAFVDDEAGAELPLRVYRRWPIQPAAPTEMFNVPQGWSDVRPGRIFGQDRAIYADDGSGDELVFGELWDTLFDYPESNWYSSASPLAPVGPIWMSEAKQVNGAVVGEWSTPVLADPAYRGWSLYPASGEMDPFEYEDRTAPEWWSWRGKAGTDSIEAGTADVEPGVESMFAIDKPIRGPFVLSFTVPDPNTQVFAGVCDVDPFEFDTGFDPDDMMAGFFTAIADNYWVEDNYHGSPEGRITGVFPFNNWAPDGEYFDDLSYAYSIGLPPANSTYRLEFDGNAYWLYVNNQLARTFYWAEWMADYDLSGVNDPAARRGHFAMFGISTPGGVVTNIKWEKRQPSQQYPYRIIDQYGPLRYVEDEAKWENVHDPMFGEGYSDWSWLMTDDFDTVKYTFRPGFKFVSSSGDHHSEAMITMQDYAGSGNQEYGFSFAPNGTYRIYGAIGNGFSDDYTYTPGVDRFSIEFTGRYVYFKKNGQPITLPSLETSNGARIMGFLYGSRAGRVLINGGMHCYCWAEIGGNAYLADVSIEGTTPDGLTVWKNEQSTTDFAPLHTAALETETISTLFGTGPWMILAETDDIPSIDVITFENRNGGTGRNGAIILGYEFEYEMLSGSGVYSPLVMSQISFDGGASWENMNGNRVEPYDYDDNGFSPPDLTLLPDYWFTLTKSKYSAYARAGNLATNENGNPLRARVFIRDTRVQPDVDDFVVAITNARLSVAFGS